MFKRILGILAWHAQDNESTDYNLATCVMEPGPESDASRCTLPTLKCTCACASAVMRRGRTAVWVRSIEVLRQSRASQD